MPKLNLATGMIEPRDTWLDVAFGCEDPALDWSDWRVGVGGEGAWRSPTAR